MFVCELSKSASSVQWKKGAVPLKSGRKYEIQQNGGELKLQIHELTSQDSGVYTCCVGALVTSASLAVKGAVLLFLNESFPPYFRIKVNSSKLYNIKCCNVGIVVTNTIFISHLFWEFSDCIFFIF